MKIGKRIATRVGVGAVCLIVAAVGFLWWYTGTDGFRARRLVAELREEPPELIERMLVGLGIHDLRQGRDPNDIVEDLAAIGATAVSYLTEALRHDAPRVRARGAWALGEMGSVAEEAIPALVAVWPDRQSEKERQALDVDEVAARALGKIGRPAVPALIEALQDRSHGKAWVARNHAAEALRYVGPAARAAVPRLILAVEDEDWMVRGQAARALGAIGVAASDSVPKLLAAMKDERMSVRLAAAEAVARLGMADDGVPFLIATLKDEDAYVYDRRTAAIALGKLGEIAEAGAGELIHALEKVKDARIQAAAAEALGKIGPATEAVIPALERAAKHTDLSIRVAALRAKKKILDGGGGA